MLVGGHAGEKREGILGVMMCPLTCIMKYTLARAAWGGGGPETHRECL